MDDAPRLQINIGCVCGNIGSATIFLNDDHPYDPPSIAGTNFTCDHCGAKLRISLELHVTVLNYPQSQDPDIVTLYKAPKMN